MIEALPDAQRRAMTLRFVFDLTPAEIADVTGTTADAVRHMQHRAMKTLASSVGDAARTRRTHSSESGAVTGFTQTDG